MIQTSFNEMSVGEIEAIHEELGFDFIINDGKIATVK